MLKDRRSLGFMSTQWEQEGLPWAVQGAVQGAGSSTGTAAGAGKGASPGVPLDLWMGQL